ncbi:MAG: transporter [Pegethrix bostrychoides GSE-TBD4-15B]|jgi:hypothetical protein|uniref:Transporter n=1 Tax=Pegethrix bostrychoides GSE-TBD4-15B TaxID=2839662 RepID=A0A951PA09_9CYAN|nr:transporter [Pegethrix bostrychoides GSE-TBD4-15B]
MNTFKRIGSTAARAFTLAATSVALSLTMAGQACAQQYGPRIFWLAPSDLNVIQFQFLYQKTNTAFDASVVYPNLDIDTTVLVGTYAPTFSLGDTSGQFILSVPYAAADVELSAGSREIDRSQAGLADIYTEFRVGLVNAPGLSPQEFVQYMTEENPRVQLRGMVGVFVPVGDYDSDRVVNIGSNRWAFRAGIPAVIRLSSNWKPGNRTTLELLPSMDVYTDNNSPPLSSTRFANTRFVADRTAQNPIFRMEGHLTQDISSEFWVSLDAQYNFGGATYADGVGQGNQQSWLGLGGTLGSNLWPGGTLSFNGGGVVARNQSSPDGWQVRFVVIQAF